jgi:hypothetical protein
MIVDLKLISYTIVSLIIFPMIYQNLLHSFENIDNELIMINKMDNINPIKNFFLFIFPITLSGLLNAIIQTLGLSIKIQIMSEILTGSTNIKGIGLLINNYRTNLEIENVFALTLMIILFVYIIELLVKKIKNMVHPRKVEALTVDGKEVSKSTIEGVQSFIIIYLIVFAVCALLISIDNFDLLTNMSASLACISNIGPGFGTVGPYGSYVGFSNFSKFILSLEMIAGRLELFPLLLLFSPNTWKKHI